jgi:hypothetical protein
MERHGTEVRARLLGEAMGIEYPDGYKRFKIKADPDTLYDEIEAHVRANGPDLLRPRPRALAQDMLANLRI